MLYTEFLGVTSKDEKPTGVRIPFNTKMAAHMLTSDNETVKISALRIAQELAESSTPNPVLENALETVIDRHIDLTEQTNSGEAIKSKWEEVKVAISAHM